MSEVRNVNRIYDPSLEAELREAGLDQVTEPQTAESFNRDKTGRIEIPPAFPFPPPTQADLIAQELREAGIEVEDDSQAQPDIKKAIEILVEKTGQSSPLPIVEEAKKFFAPRDPDLREFKGQVIKAFRHLGLDTKQFFGV